jgi:superfamily II DNA or RNA helicase
MIMEAFFGPVIANFSYQDSVEKGTATPIEVWMYETDGPRITGKQIATKKRYAYWRNAYRNALIATVSAQIPEDEQVLIMVETTEHAMYLKRLLPEYTLVYGDSLKEDDMNEYVSKGFLAKQSRLTPADRKELRDKFKDGSLKRVIATTVWKQAVDFPELTWLIRGDASSSEIRGTQIPGRLSRLAEGKSKAILVDFTDGFDPWASRRAMKRMKTYASKGWRVIRKGTMTYGKQQ